MQNKRGNYYFFIETVIRLCSKLVSKIVQLNKSVIEKMIELKIYDTCKEVLNEVPEFEIKLKMLSEESVVDLQKLLSLIVDFFRKKFRSRLLYYKPSRDKTDKSPLRSGINSKAVFSTIDINAENGLRFAPQSSNLIGYMTPQGSQKSPLRQKASTLDPPAPTISNTPKQKRVSMEAKMNQKRMSHQNSVSGNSKNGDKEKKRSLITQSPSNKKVETPVGRRRNSRTQKPPINMDPAIFKMPHNKSQKVLQILENFSNSFENKSDPKNPKSDPLDPYKNYDILRIENKPITLVNKKESKKSQVERIFYELLLGNSLIKATIQEFRKNYADYKKRAETAAVKDRQASSKIEMTAYTTRQKPPINNNFIQNFQNFNENLYKEQLANHLALSPAKVLKVKENSNLSSLKNLGKTVSPQKMLVLPKFSFTHEPIDEKLKH
jgi:hypothetical protein